MATSTSTSNFSQAKVDAYIRKKLLELGEHKFLFRRFVNKERIEPGNGTAWRALRYSRLDVPLSALTEGVAPSETDLEINTVSATAVQYGLTIKITDVLQLTINHSVVQKALVLKSDVMAALDDRIIAEQALTGTNVFYGGTATARSGMNAAGGDVLTTNILRKAVASLRATDGVAGQAPSPAGVPDGMYVGLIHEKQIFDVQKDATWEGAAFRQDLGALKRGAVKEWAGVVWYASSFLPVFKNSANGMASLTLHASNAVSDSRYLNGLKAVVSDTGGSLTSQAYKVKIVARHKKRGFAEIISSELTTASTGTGNDDSIALTMPSDTNYWYTAFMGTTTGDSNLYRVVGLNNVAAGTIVTVTASTQFPNTNPNPPVAPPRHTSSVTSEAADVFSGFVLGGDCLAVVDLSDLESYMTNGPDAANPLNQFSIMGSKFMLGATVLQNLFMARIESQSAFGA